VYESHYYLTYFEHSLNCEIQNVYQVTNNYEDNDIILAWAHKYYDNHTKPQDSVLFKLYIGISRLNIQLLNHQP